MSLASNKLLKTIYKGQNPNDKSTRLAKVISGQSSTGYIVQFFGEENPSIKKYKSCLNLSISAGYTVIMSKINGTYVITGRVS